MNKIYLLGHISFVGEMTETTGGFKVIKLGLATNKSKKTQAGTYTQVPTFHVLTCWGAVAERAVRYQKGQRVFVEGSMEVNQYTSKAGVAVKEAHVVVERIFEAESGGGTKGEGTYTKKEENPVETDIIKTGAQGFDEISVEDLPF